MYFERAGLIKDKQFINEAAANRAVHVSQYLVTGLTNTEEPFLVLNKLLCGLPEEYAIIPVEITEEEKQLGNSLITAAIGYWPAIGNQSIDGFRGNWLVRDGLLAEQEDRYHLTVDKRAYDLLLNHSPFSFSIIKYAWMKKPLYINWPY
jgi:hypothetical protein